MRNSLFRKCHEYVCLDEYNDYFEKAEKKIPRDEFKFPFHNAICEDICDFLATGQSAILIGNSGLGKSWILFECAQRLEGSSVIRNNCIDLAWSLINQRHLKSCELTLYR